MYSILIDISLREEILPDGRVRVSLANDGKKYLGVGFNSEIAKSEAAKHVLLAPEQRNFPC